MSDLPSQTGGGGQNQLTISPQQNLPSALPEGVPSVLTASGVAYPPLPVENVPRKPLRLHRLSEEKLEMLATLPRKKWDEFTWAALTGAIGAAPSAVQAISSAYQRDPFSLLAFESVQVAICGGFLVWFLARLGMTREKTSIDLLKELCRGDAADNSAAS